MSAVLGFAQGSYFIVYALYNKSRRVGIFLSAVVPLDVCAGSIFWARNFGDAPLNAACVLVGPPPKEVIVLG